MSRNRSGVSAFWPMGWEWKNTASTACSISRPSRSAGTSRCTSRAFSNSLTSREAQSDLPSPGSFVAISASSLTASESAVEPDAVEPGFARNADGPTSGAPSRSSLSRIAIANTRRIPRVRWNPESWVQRL